MTPMNKSNHQQSWSLCIKSAIGKNISIMRNIVMYLISVAFFISFSIPNQCIGQEYVGLYKESTARSILSDGVWIEAFSIVNEPTNKGIFIQYRKVLRIEKSVTGPDGSGNWYYNVYFGPLIPNDGGYVFWPSGDQAPWLTAKNPPIGPSDWTCVHEHIGCDTKESFCLRYDDQLITFSALEQGTVKAEFRGITLTGDLSGTIYQFTYTSGNSLGKGTFNFSPDFKSFSGYFSDSNGHRGRWWGQRN